MSKKVVSAEKAMAKAKKNSLARKARTKKELLARAKEKIEEMIAAGVVSTTLWLSEDEYDWASREVSIELQRLGYEILFSQVDEKDEDEIPDMEISIAHLK
jgi:hypothetical protein